MSIIDKLQKHYQNSKDIKFKINPLYTLIYCEGLSNTKLIEEEILRKIEKHLSLNPADIVSSLLTIKPIQKPSLEILDEYVFSGMCLFYYQKNFYTINVINVPKRTPDQSISDITITGPRDSFIENLETNVALIRKRLKTSKLNYLKFTLGQHTKTQIGLLYLEDRCDLMVIDQLKNKLDYLKENDISSVGQFRQLLLNKKPLLFPRMTYTTRPDHCVSCLLKGKFVLLVDNFNNANIGPVTIPLFLELSDDVNDHYITTFINRFLYYFSAFISIFLMPFILALYSYHPQSIPFLWLSNILSLQKGKILPVYLEIIFATLLFELFRVAGTRLPAGISSTLLVIGSVLLGQNITSSGFIGYDIMFLSAFSIICNYSISNNISFNGVITVFKIFTFIASLCFGLVGFTFALMMITLYLCGLTSFGQEMATHPMVIDLKVFLKRFKSMNYTITSWRKK